MYIKLYEKGATFLNIGKTSTCNDKCVNEYNRVVSSHFMRTQLILTVNKQTERVPVTL